MIGFTTRLDQEFCTECDAELFGAGKVELSPGFPEGDVWSVDDKGWVIEGQPEKGIPNTHVCLDYQPNVRCAACGCQLECTHTQEDA